MNRNKNFIPLRENKYQFRFGTMKDKDKILSFIHSNWPGRWHKEAIDYFINGGNGKEYLLCLDNEKVIGFAKVNFPDTDILQISNNLTWRHRFDALGGIGPLGIDKDYRKQNLGFNIVAYAVNKLNEENASNIIIDWTGLLDFYRLLGFEVWKTYYYLNKKLRGDYNA
jgi:predicted GNAT family N-acyltransferase